MRLLPILLLAAALPSLADDQSDFSSAPDGTWQRYDPRQQAGFSPSFFYFGGGQCRIICWPPTTIDEYNAYGLPRAGLFAPSVMTDSVASVDISGWYPSENRNLDGIHMFALTRVQSPIGLGSLTGYAAVIIDMGANSGPGGVGRNGRLQIMLLYQEQALTNFGQYLDFPFNPDHDYRLILVSRGDVHTARVFDLTNPVAPLAQLVVQDDQIPFGRTGFIIYNDRLAPLDVTFDNFLAWDGTPPPQLIQPGAEPGTIALSSDLHRSLATDLQGTTDFTDPLTPWLPATPASVSVAGNQFVTIFPIDGPRRFFRRKSL
jgi:hypothetical protein